MARTPSSRYPTALAFARALQQVQTELGFGTAPVSVLDDVVTAEPEHDEDDPGTRIRRVVSIDPDSHPTSGTAGRVGATSTAGPPPTGPAEGATAGAGGSSSLTLSVEDTERRRVPRPPPGPWAHAPATPPVEETLRRDVTGPSGSAVESVEPPRRSRGVLVLAALAVLAVVVVAALALTRGSPPASTADTPSSAPQDVSAVVVPSPEDLSGALDGDQVVFTWTNPDPQDGDTYLWRVVSALGEGTAQQTDQPTATVPADLSGQTCVEVYIARSGKSSLAPARTCAP